MKTTAAVLVELGRPLALEELEIPALRPGQVLVELAYSGVCHTQVLEWRGHRGEDRFLPHCLGHEGSGIVREIGAGVTRVGRDDRVVCSWLKASGANVPGTVYAGGGRGVNAGAITTFGRLMVMSENRVTRLPADIALRDAAALGCAVPTGAGMVVNVAGARQGQSLAVFGAGGVGLCALATAAAIGCAPLIAIDMLESKLAVARQLGATHCVRPADEDPVAAARRICPGGVDFAIEATGVPAVMSQALAAVRAQGGIAVVAGNARHGERLALDPGELNQGKQLRGTWGGDTDPDRDFPRYFELLAAGRLAVGWMFQRTYAIEEITRALEDLERGDVVRPLIQLAPG